MITLTEKSAEKVREFLSAQNAVAATAGLRVGVLAPLERALHDGHRVHSSTVDGVTGPIS